ncbi:MAG: hypothetical protein ACU837_16990 [Gammaproteobacteria bacterium]
MHFRTRKNVVQLVRTIYDQANKKPKAVVVGSIPLDNPVISDELRKKLTGEEIAAAETWINYYHRAALLRDELAALTLAETLRSANRWFARQGESEQACIAVAEMLPELQALRKTLKSSHLLG